MTGNPDIELRAVDITNFRAVGRRLVEQVIKELAQRSDCQRIVLSVDPDNVSAVVLYEHAGFSIYGRDAGIDVLMEYRLDA